MVRPCRLPIIWQPRQLAQIERVRRIPSALCGLTGFKPTAARVSTKGAFPLSTHWILLGLSQIVLHAVLSWIKR